VRSIARIELLPGINHLDALPPKRPPHFCNTFRLCILLWKKATAMQVASSKVFAVVWCALMSRVSSILCLQEEDEEVEWKVN
jgi:hypothetical protein